MPDRAPLEQAERKVRQIGRLIAESCPPGWHFALILASAGTDGFMTYLSNVVREDMVKLLRETADKLERQEPNV